MTYQDCVDYLFNLHRFGVRLGLETMLGLCAKLGNPQQRLKFVHIAGTNGKGSVAACLDSILREAGHRTGLYTSPHLVEMGERIRICGEPISRDDIVRLTLKIRSVLETSPELAHVSFFEFLTAMALLHFEANGVDVVVWETGLGGRLDATNVVEPECCVITGIGYDHTEYLGDTLAKIAAEKAGILKKDKPLVLGVRASEAREVILKRAEALDCKVYSSLEEQIVSGVSRDVPSGRFLFEFRGRRWELGLKGSYQCWNAALALEVCDVLQERGLAIPMEARRRGLSNVSWPGRFEVLSWDPPWVLDGAHNEEGLEKTLASWKDWFQEAPRQVVFGCVAEKDLDAMARQFPDRMGVIRLVRLSTKRSQSLETMQAAFSGRQTIAYSSLTEALADCRASGESTLIVGSLYLVGEVLALLKENPHELQLNG